MHLNKTTGQLNPSLATLAKESGSTKPTVIEALEVFEKRGHTSLLKEGRPGAGHSAERGLLRCVEKGILADDLFVRSQRLWESDPKRSQATIPEPIEPIRTLRAQSARAKKGARSGAQVGANGQAKIDGQASEALKTTLTPQPLRLRQMPKGPPTIPNGNRGTVERAVANKLGSYEKLYAYAERCPEGFARLIDLASQDEAAAWASPEFLQAATTH